MTPCWLLAVCLELPGAPSLPAAPSFAEAPSFAAGAPQDVRPRVQLPEGRGDGVYGRFEHDLEAGLAAGADLVSKEPALALRATLHHYWTAGVFVAAALPLGQGARNEGSVLGFGVDLRPAFLPRFSENLERGPARLDLAVDSISLGIGPYFRFADDTRDSRGLDVSLGFGIPLAPRATGPWVEVRGVGRLPDGNDPSQVGGVILLGWHHGFDSPWLGDLPAGL